MTDYRATAMAWVAEPEHRPAVDAIARHLHYNESLHLHDMVEGREPCSYCWLRAAKAVQAIERDSQRILRNDHVETIRKDRERFRAENERLHAELDERDSLIASDLAGLRDAVEAVIEDGDSEVLAAMIVDRIVGPLAAEVKRFREDRARLIKDTRRAVALLNDGHTVEPRNILTWLLRDTGEGQC